jgi:hypothetical protein
MSIELHRDLSLADYSPEARDVARGEYRRVSEIWNSHAGLVNRGFHLAL